MDRRLRAVLRDAVLAVLAALAFGLAVGAIIYHVYRP